MTDNLEKPDHTLYVSQNPTSNRKILRSAKSKVNIKANSIGFKLFSAMYVSGSSIHCVVAETIDDLEIMWDSLMLGTELDKSKAQKVIVLSQEAIIKPAEPEPDEPDMMDVAVQMQEGTRE
ncbi:MAG: hypothetical protein ABFD75_12125 [Smithella sp.]